MIPDPILRVCRAGLAGWWTAVEIAADRGLHCLLICTQEGN